MKIRSVGACYIGTDGRADMTKLTVAVRNFASAPSDGNYERALIKLHNFFGHLFSDGFKKASTQSR